MNKLNNKHPNGTHKGPAMYRLFHQYQEEVLIRDEYVHHFFDDTEADTIKKRFASLNREPVTAEEKWTRNVYAYAILREKNGDDVVASSIEKGCGQILNLGAGFCTRFFRIPSIREKFVKVIEVDLPQVVQNKLYYIRKFSGEIPEGLSLVSMNFNLDDLHALFHSGFNPDIPSVYIWEGVSYYLARETVSKVLDFIRAQMVAGSAFVFDCCTPLLLYQNKEVPGVGFNIDFLARMGQPYLFGMERNEMRGWLEEKGFENMEIINQDDLEYRYLNKRTIPDNMFYIINIYKT